jgi:hypothetical protein
MTAKKERFITVQNAAGTRVALAIDKVEQVSYEVVRAALGKHLVLRLPSSNVAVAHEEQERVLSALGVKDLETEEKGATS